MPEMSDATALLHQTGWVQALARSLATDPDVAEDLAQDTWVTALERAPDTDRSLRGWLATVLRNHVSKARRRDGHRRERERDVSREEQTPSTFDLVAKATTQKDLVESVLELEEPYRETILLRFFENLSYRDIATRMSVSPATVNSRLTRGLARLRERLDSRYGNRQAWLTAIAPLTQFSKGAAALGAGALTMTTVTQISLFVVASTAVATVAWQSGQGAPSGVADALRAPVSLAGHTGSPEGIELLEPAPPASEGREALGKLELPAELASAEPFTAEDDDTWQTELSYEHVLGAGVEGLTVNSGAGDVVIVRGEGRGVRIDAKVKADLDRVDANGLTQAFEDHVIVQEAQGSLEIGDAHSKGREQGWQVSLTVHVPDGLAMNVSANSGAGDVLVKHASGDVRANSGAGDVDIDVPQQDVGAVMANSGAGDVTIAVGMVRGKLDANSGAGDVTAGIANASGSPQVRLNSGAGDVSILLPQNVSGSFDLRTSTGTVKVAPSLGLVVEKQGEVGQRARGVVGVGGPSYHLESGAGDVVVGLGQLER